MKFGMFPRLMFAVFLFVVIFITIAVVSYVVNKSTLSEWLKNPQPPGQLIELSTGKTYATTKGEGKTTVVFLSGIGAPSAEWWNIQDAISKDFYTITYDRPGYTWSTPHVSTNYDIQKSIITELLQKLNVEPSANIILVGQNLGANIARKIYERSTLQIKGLVLIDPLLNPSQMGTQLEQEWRELFIDQTAKLDRFRLASKLGIFRFVNITPYDVPDNIRPIVINNIANAQTATAVADEYRNLIANDATVVSQESCPIGSQNISTIVIHHNAEQNIELMKSFGAPTDVATEIEDSWQKNSLSYQCNKLHPMIFAKKSVFDIHISEPELIINAIQKIAR